MKSKLTLFLFAFVALSFLSGCASVISKGVLVDIDRTITVAMVQSDPELYNGRKVLWGGVIVSTKNLKEHSRIEVLAQKLAFMDQPQSNDQASQGRFLIMAPGYKDPLVYKPDMLITVAGIVKGVKSEKIGEMSYPYVLITPVEMKTFDPAYESDRYDYPYWRDYPFYGPYPYYPNDPFLDPYYGPYYPGLPPYFYPQGYFPSGYPGHHHRN
jgi:outer membrane lipoprotein